MIWIPIVLAVGISSIIGVAQALVLRYLLGRSMWWAASWLLAGALMIPISWIIDDMGVIIGVAIANLIQWRMLQGNTPYPNRWIWACAVALIASVCAVLVVVLLFWVLERGDVPSPFGVNIALLVGITIYAVITGFGLTKALDLA
jgi:hypothetical protein